MSMEYIKKHWLLLVIIFVAAILRVYKIDSVPPSPSLDEVSLGWNAYSVMKTGRDEYGTQFPILLRAYDDYRPALYLYLIIPFLSFFGLSAVSVRLPSILLALVSVYATYAIANLLFPPKKWSFQIRTQTLTIGHFAALFLAISPWHIYISRLGHEVNLGFTMGILGILFFLSAVFYNKQKFFLFSALSFVAGLYGYQSQKIIIPIIGIGLIFLFWDTVWKARTWVIVSGVISLVLLVPLFMVSLSPQGLLRFKGTTAFSEDNIFYEKTRQEFIIAKERQDIVSMIIHHPKLTTPRIFLNNYFSHFSPEWLFTGTVQASHKIPYVGLLYPWEFPLILIGIYLCIKQRDRIAIFLLLWFLSSPLPAAITTQAPHAMRSYTFLPTWQIFAALGITFSLSSLSKRLRTGGLLLIASLCVVSVGILFHNYFFLFSSLQSQAFSYAIKEAMPYVLSHHDEYPHVIFSNLIGIKEFEYPTYMFFLFYSAYDPARYLSFGGTKTGGFGSKLMFDKYEFRTIHGNEEKGNLYVINKRSSPEGAKQLYTSSYLDGSAGVLVYTL